MPNTKQAKKELRKSEKKAVLNLNIKQDIKTLIKKTRKAIDEKIDKAKIDEMIKQIQVKIDKAIKKNVIKKNTGRRRLSRLMAYYHKDNKSKKEQK